MDMIKELGEMKETIANEIAEANRKIQQNGGNMNTADIDIIDKLTHSMKSLVTACTMLEAEEGEYSNGYMYYSGRESREGREGRNGYSRENRTGGLYGGSYARRYSRENRNSYGGYSRNGEMMEHLRAMLDEAPDEQTRMEVRQLMEKYSQR